MLIIAFIFVGITIAFNALIDIPNFSIFFTFVGQIPVFALGIYFAARPQIKIPALVILASLVVFAAANFYELAYHFSFLSVTILLLAIMILLLPPLERRKNLSDFFVFTGKISLFLFVIHGGLRYPFVGIAEKYSNPLLNVALAFAFLAVAYIVALWIRIIEKQIQELIASGYNFKVLLKRIDQNDY